MTEFRAALPALGLLFALLCPAHAAPPSGDEIHFGEHKMRAELLPLRNAEFRESASEGDPHPVPGWAMANASSPSHFREGRDGGQSIALSGSVSGDGGVTELFQDIGTGWLRRGEGGIYLSAWVWSDTPGGALLQLSDRERGKTTLSAFHSGAARWEYLTVAYPYAEPPVALRASLMARKGTARFAEAKAVTLHDDRFTNVPDGCNPLRERATYRKSGRVRIVVVGNSTVNGAVVADKRATFPYILQAKLESAFPGRFEVVNFGICGWHLPPQIVTLDKVFNMHQWCSGAPWCGKEVPFSHRAALAGAENADRNTPTISQLNPDVIIFAGMWNDVWRVLRYAESGFAPHPDEVNRNEAVPASVEYLRAAFSYVDDPTPANSEVADTAWGRAIRPLDAATLAELDLRDLASLRTSAAFARLVENARKKFGYLSEEFVRRGQRKARVWTLALPGRFKNRYEEAARRLLATGMLPEAEASRFMRNGYIDSVAEDIQGGELARISRELHAPFLDLGDRFQQQYGAMSVGEQFALGYFLDNVEDNAHFTYRGNEWIADQLFHGFQEEFGQLVRQHSHVTRR